MIVQYNYMINKTSLLEEAFSLERKGVGKETSGESPGCFLQI